MRAKLLLGWLALFACVNIIFSQSANLGIFTAAQDVGHPAYAGTAKFDSASGTYSISGGGTNMWLKNDDFQFVYKQMSGDFDFSTTVNWPKPGGNPHRKACLMVRQSLDGDSAYVDVAQHGVGLTALQFRGEKGGKTQEIQTTFYGPTRIGIEKRGDYFSFWISTNGEELHPAGGSFKLVLTEPFYIGLAVCAHDNQRIEQADFSKVELTPLPPLRIGEKGDVQSTLEFMLVSSTDRTVVLHTNVNIQAPNWTKDNNLIYNSGGKLYRVGVNSLTPPVLIDTEGVADINNDHGISPDGTQLAISAGNPSKIYVGPIGGGAFKLVTPEGPSYFHGWSPDGKTLAFCGDRNDEYDVYTIPAAGGAEKRLTTSPGLDDGPEYSPDGQYIYFNSVRSGSMQIWRMKPDGSEQMQMTPNDDHNNWFAHISPDGRRMVFLTFNHDVPADKHPPNQDVMLRTMVVGGGPITPLASFFGGQGTINVASWSPDSRILAFVSYTTIYPK